MKLQKIVNEYLESIKYSIKQKTYLFYLQICEIYIAKFTSALNSFIIICKKLVFLQQKLSKV